MFHRPIDIDGIKETLLTEERRKREGKENEILIPKNIAVPFLILFIIISIVLGIIGLYITK